MFRTVFCERSLGRPSIIAGPSLARLGLELLEDLKPIFKTAGKVMIFPSSGTGAWEAGIVNTLSPGDKVLMFETGQFATLWKDMAVNLGLDVHFVASDWRHGADPAEVESILREDRGHKIKAVMVVHNETSSAVTNSVPAMRKALDRAGHPALLMVDTISSLGSMDYRHDEWGVDVAIAGSQKGLMLPPGLGFNAVSEKALAASKSARHAAILLGLAGHARAKQDWLLSLYARDESALWTARVARRCCTKRAWRTCSRGTPGMGKPRGAPCGPGDSRWSARTRNATAVP